MHRALRIVSARIGRKGPAARRMLVLLLSIVCSALHPAEASEPSDTAQTPPVFSGERALAHVVDLVTRGERHYGAKGREEAIAHLVSLLEPHASSVERQTFERREPVSGIDYRLTNIVAHRNPDAHPRILLGSHFDTRRWAEDDADPARRDEPIPGANDGTSGVAVLIELLRVVDGTPGLRELGLDVVLFDGEEFGRPGNDVYCQGSRHYVDVLKRAGSGEGLPSAAVVIDMVGDRDLLIRKETSSFAPLSRGLAELLWKYGRRITPDVFVDWPAGVIIDDQSPFQQVGIPAVLVIDLEYPHWHTHQDTVDKLSAESLGVVGHTLIAALPSIERFAVRAASGSGAADPAKPTAKGPSR